MGHPLLGAKEVITTDLPQLVDLIQANIDMNNLTNCRAAALTWGDDPAPFNPPFDVILIADVVRSPTPLLYLGIRVSICNSSLTLQRSS